MKHVSVEPQRVHALDTKARDVVVIKGTADEIAALQEQLSLMQIRMLPDGKPPLLPRTELRIPAEKLGAFLPKGTVEALKPKPPAGLSADGLRTLEEVVRNNPGVRQHNPGQPLPPPHQVVVPPVQEGQKTQPSRTTEVQIK